MPIFDFNSIPLCLQQWLPIITETPKIQCRIVIPQVLDENLWLFFNLSQRGLQLVSDIFFFFNDIYVRRRYTGKVHPLKACVGHQEKKKKR